MGNKISTSDSLAIIEKLESLEPGGSFIYFTGYTGWLDDSLTHMPLLRWCLRAQMSGKWTFVQRKLRVDQAGITVFEYIAILLRVPNLPDENYVYQNRLSPIR